MGFYYLSIFSLLFIALIYVVAIGMFWFLWVRVIGRRFTGPIVWVVVAAILIAPWAEELWIAYHFGQACKEAGTFIYKKVQVEGFYDDTRPTHAGPRTQQAVEDLDRGGYRFYEMVLPNKKGRPNQVVHLEKVRGQWTATVLDQPTARYHYKWPSPYGARVGYKVGKSERVVIDTETNEQVARYVAFGRRPPWFWIGLDTPAFACDAPGRWPLARGNPLIYRDVLIPVEQR